MSGVLFRYNLQCVYFLLCDGRHAARHRAGTALLGSDYFYTPNTLSFETIPQLPGLRDLKFEIWSCYSLENL